MSIRVIDPTFFNDVIKSYSSRYTAFIVKDVVTDAYGMRKAEFHKLTVEGSLQTQGTSLSQKTSGNTVTARYRFYCKATYRLNIGDFILYNDKLLHVTDSQEYDEYGVRECSLEMTQLNEHRDLKEFVDFQTGEKVL